MVNKENIHKKRLERSVKVRHKFWAPYTYMEYVKSEVKDNFVKGKIKYRKK